MAAKDYDQEQIAISKTMNNIPHCEQYDRMISGMLYDSFTPELEASRLNARRFCHKYNNWFPSDSEELTFQILVDKRHEMLKTFLGAIGDECFIEPPFTADYGCNLRLGHRVYMNFNFVVLDCAIVTIGDRTMFGPNVSILAATHETEVQSRRDNIEYAKAVTVGADCWIGGHTVILPGVTIGDGVTIGAGSIVTRDIPSWSVAMGQPARVVKKVTPLEPLAGEKSRFSAVERTG